MARPMTIAEKILAAHAGEESVEPGQLINCALDIVLANDVTAPIAIKEFRKTGVEKVWNAGCGWSSPFPPAPCCSGSKPRRSAGAER